MPFEMAGCAKEPAGRFFDQVADLAGEGRPREVAAALNDAVTDGDAPAFGQGRALRAEEAQNSSRAADGGRETGSFFGDGVAVDA